MSGLEMSPKRQKRMRDAIAVYKARQQEGGENIITHARWTDTLPVLEEDSPDLNAFDNVTPISKHPRWRKW